MNNLWDKLTDNPLVAIFTLICFTIFGCTLVFGGVSCQKAEYEYRLKRQELQNQGSETFWKKDR